MRSKRRGSAVTHFLPLDAGLTIFHMTHNGSSNFAIWLLDSGGNRIELLVNEIGRFDGAKAVGLNRSGSYLLDVSATDAGMSPSTNRATYGPRLRLHRSTGADNK